MGKYGESGNISHGKSWEHHPKKRKKQNIGTSHGNYIWDEFPMIFPWNNHWKLTIYGKLSRYGNPWKSSQKYGGVFWEGTSSLSK